MVQKKNINPVSLFNNTRVEEDFRIELSDNKLPFNQGISRISEAMVCVCLKGEIHIEVDIQEHHIKENTYFMLFPGQIVNLKSISGDFETMYYTLSLSPFNEMLFRFPPEFTTFLKTEGVYQDTPENVEVEKKWYEMMRKVYDDKENVSRREILLNYLRIFYLELYNYTYKLLESNPARSGRKTEIFEQFVKSVKDDYKVNREVLFYANKLNISAKYLSLVTQEQNGRNAKKWIDEYVASEIKIRLKSSNESLQEMAFDLNFADQSFLSKFFKRQTGMSPSDYRKRVV